MRFLKPITESEAPPAIKEIYQRIRHSLNSPFTPVVFQIIANYEDYLVHLWNQLESNLQSATFQSLPPKISHYANTTTQQWVTLDPTLANFSSTLTPTELAELQKTTSELTQLNATLTLLTIALRESLKGIPVGVLKLVAETSKEAHEFSQASGPSVSAQNVTLLGTSTDISATSALLAPLIGNQSLAISRYAQFFHTISKYMDKLIKTETYLRRRVIMEELVLTLVPQLPQPLSTTYQEFMEFTQSSPQTKHVHELLFLLHDLFPSKFPHLVFTTSIMHHVLSP